MPFLRGEAKTVEELEGKHDERCRRTKIGVAVSSPDPLKVSLLPKT